MTPSNKKERHIMIATKPTTNGIESGQTSPAPTGGLMKLARSAGVLYLINIIGGAFALSIIPALFFWAGAAEMAHNIHTHQTLYPAGLAAHVLVPGSNIFLAVVL